MSFTYTPADIAIDSATYLSAVRWLVQDIDSVTAEVSDEEIDALFETTSESESQTVRNLRTGLAVAKGLHRRYAKQATFSSGGSSFQLGARAQAWADIVKDIEGQLADAVSLTVGSSPGVLQFGRGPSFDDGSGTW
jgi:hypothetical protein